MRLVLVTHFFPSHGGGIELVAAQIARRLAAEGHSVVWCASDVDPVPEIPGVESRPMRSLNLVERISGFPYPLWSPAALRQLAREIRAADAVHVHDAIYAGSLVAAWLARRADRRLVVTQHIATVPLPTLLRPVFSFANRAAAAAVLARADSVAFISPEVRRHFEGVIGERSGFGYVPNGVDAAVFHPPAGDRESLKETLGFDPRRPLLLFVGRFVAKKRLSFVRALAVRRADWQWCVVGQGPENPAAWALPNVAVPGPMSPQRLATLYQAADLLVLPSVGEGFPLVVQEAMACGLVPCIRAEVAAGAGLPDRLSVRLPPDGTPAVEECDLAERAIEQALERPPLELTLWRDEIASHARSHWSWDASARWHADRLFGPSAR
jgi:glycosyltransferase involved in cell wall biosynthesis